MFENPQNLLILFSIIAYFIGSIPSGVITAKMLGLRDPRTVGSHNIGATNVMRTGGKKAGAITLTGDLLKGFIPALVAKLVFDDTIYVSIVALASFLGHIFPIYLKFRGGKGVATAMGIMLALNPMAVPIIILTFLSIVKTTEVVSIGSIMAAIMSPVLMRLFEDYRPYTLLWIVIAILVVAKHHANIRKLIKGIEPKYSKKV